MFIDLNVNFLEFTVREALDFICYFSFKCNGTSLIAEIHRRIMSDNEKYWAMYMEQSSFYEFLCKVNEEISYGTAIGSCTENRFTFSSGSSQTEWDDKQDELFHLCQLFFLTKRTVSKLALLREKTSEVIHQLLHSTYKDNKRRVYVGAGPMGINQFIHLSALLGLIPLACYNFAEINDNSLGPGLLMNNVLVKDGQRKMSSVDCNAYLQEFKMQFSNIWGEMITENLIENTLCVLHRSYQRTKKMILKHDEVVGPKIPITILKNDSLRKESNTKDVIYMDEARKCIQSVFSLRIVGKSSSTLRPSLCMKFGKLWNKGEKAHFVLSNFRNDKNDKGHIGWGSNSCGAMTVDSKFETSTMIDELFKL